MKRTIFPVLVWLAGGLPTATIPANELPAPAPTPPAVEYSTEIVPFTVVGTTAVVAKSANAGDAVTRFAADGGGTVSITASSRRQSGETKRTLGQRIFGSVESNKTEVLAEEAPTSPAGLLQPQFARDDGLSSRRADWIPLTDGQTVTSEPVAPRVLVRDEAEPSPLAAPVIVDQQQLSPELLELRDRIRMTLAHYYARPESTTARSPWGVMHAFIGFGVDTQLMVGNRQVNAIAWTCWNGPCYGMRLFYADGGYVVPRIGPGYQGHPGQFLAMMAQCKVKADYGLKIDGQDFTIRDLIEYEKVTCKANTELTFKLIGLSHYLESNARWKDQHGGDWDIERLIAEELKQPIIGATCGGTHRMMGFTYAVRKREDRGEPLTGQWKRAKTYLDDYHAYTFKLQNDDGSFSTNWFEGRGDSGGIDRRLQTTGHILEWFSYSLPREQLTDPRVIHSVNYLTNLMWQHRTHDWEIGPKGHAIHALAIYDERMFGGKPGQRASQLAALNTQHR